MLGSRHGTGPALRPAPALADEAARRADLPAGIPRRRGRAAVAGDHPHAAARGGALQGIPRPPPRAQLRRQLRLRCQPSPADHGSGRAVASAAGEGCRLARHRCRRTGAHAGGGISARRSAGLASRRARLRDRRRRVAGRRGQPAVPTLSALAGTTGRTGTAGQARRGAALDLRDARGSPLVLAAQRGAGRDVALVDHVQDAPARRKR